MPKQLCSIILTVFLYMAFVLPFASQIGSPIFAIAGDCCECDFCDAGAYMTDCIAECGPKVRPLAIVRDGDPLPITINAEQQMLNLEVPQKEILARLAEWKKLGGPKYGRGILAKYAAQVSSAPAKEQPAATDN